MFIRWIVRGHKNTEIADVTFHDAYLVESYRDENGTPRQQTVAYLGNIRQIGEDFPGIERELFLLRAEFIMETISRISPAERKQIIGQLHQKVPPLDAREAEIGFHNTLRWFFRWWRDNGGAPGEEELMKIVQMAREKPDDLYLGGE